MTEKVFQPAPDFAKNAHANKEKYELMYADSVSNPDIFWAEHGKRIDWITPFTKVKNTSFEYPNISIKKPKMPVNISELLSPKISLCYPEVTRVRTLS